jgi:hypothetical protein
MEIYWTRIKKDGASTVRACAHYEERTQHFQRGALAVNGRDTEKS